MEFRSYRIIDGEVTEEEVTVLPQPRTPRTEVSDPMAIEVRIPTILRTYTGGEKAVQASVDAGERSRTWRATTRGSRTG